MTSNFDRCQRAFDNMLPPEYEEPDYEEDCEDGECGKCYPCVSEALEAYEDARGEYLYEQKKERERGDL